MKQNLIDYGYGVGALVAHRGMNDLRIYALRLINWVKPWWGQNILYHV
jgi:hypothetical protein